MTWYVPVPPGRNETDIWLPLTRALPVSTRWPAALVTFTLLKAGSSFCVNQSVTSRGGVATLLPTRGSALSEKMNDRMTALKRRLREIRGE